MKRNIKRLDPDSSHDELLQYMHTDLAAIEPGVSPAWLTILEDFARRWLVPVETTAITDCFPDDIFVNDFNCCALKLINTPNVTETVF